MREKGWSTTDFVVVGLAAALVVFFAGVTAAIAAGKTPPTPMWAAGSAIAGALIGLLVPPPGAKARHQLATKEADEAAAGAKSEAEAARAAEAAETHRAAAASSPETKGAAIFLFLFFLLSLGLGIVLAAGAIVPPQPFIDSLKSVTTAVIALASASGSALIGLLAPSTGKGA
jgi:hypothetical protein